MSRQFEGSFALMSFDILQKFNDLTYDSKCYEIQNDTFLWTFAHALPFKNTLTHSFFYVCI